MNNSNYKIELAQKEDNEELLELFSEYAVSSESFGYIMDRNPDFFKFLEFAGSDYRVIVAKKDNKIIGSITVIFKKVYLDGKEKFVAYTAELRVIKQERKTGIADILMEEAIKYCREIGGKDISVFTVVMKDNKAGLKKNQNLGTKNIINMLRIGEVKIYFILPINTKKFLKKSNYFIRKADNDDIPEMLELWKKVNKNKNLAQVLDISTFKKQILDNPKLDISDYILAIKDNKIQGFLGLFDQSDIRKIIVMENSKVVRIARKFWNNYNPFGLGKLPKPGEHLHQYNTLNLCVPSNQEKILSELIIYSFNILKNKNALFLALPLDEKDNLNKALKGFVYMSSEIFVLSNHIFDNYNSLLHMEISQG